MEQSETSITSVIDRDIEYWQTRIDSLYLTPNLRFEEVMRARRLSPPRSWNYSSALIADR